MFCPKVQIWIGYREHHWGRVWLQFSKREHRKVFFRGKAMVASGSSRSVEARGIVFPTLSSKES